MSWLTRLFHSLRSHSLDREIEEELQFHLEARFHHNLAAGMTAEEARRQANHSFGNQTLQHERARDADILIWLETVTQDLRVAFRLMRHRPAFTAMILLLVALGIGASTSMFSLVTATILKQPPFERSGSLVYLWRANRQGEFQVRLPYRDLPDLRDRSRSLERFATFQPEWFLVNGPRGPQRVYGYDVAANWFPALQANPVIGRNFLPGEAQPGRANVAILSDKLWKRMFQANPHVIGSRIAIQDRTLTIVGILPENFDFDKAEIFTPLVPDEKAYSRGIFALANLRPGIGLPQAQSDVDSIVAGWARSDPASWKDWSVQLQTPAMQVSRECGPTCAQAHRGVWVLFGAVGLILLMACANVANLLLAHSLARRREFLIRTAIGCSRLRLVRQNLTESMLLFMCGGTLGVLVAWWSKTLLATVAAGYLGTTKIQLDGRVLVFSAAITLLTGMLFGLLPALRSSGSPSARIGHNLTRSLLVTSEFALALVLLIGFGLLLRSFLYVEAIPVGIRTDRLLTIGTTLSGAKFQNSAQRISFAAKLLAGVRDISGVEAAALTSHLPLTGADATDIQIEGIPPTGADGTEVRYISASPELFSTLRIPLLEGRALSNRDTQSAAPVAVINRTMAERFFPHDDALGRRIHLKEEPEIWREIVGVAADVRQRNLEEDSRPVFYRPYLQGLDESLNVALRVRSQADMPRVAEALRKTVALLDTEQPWDQVTSMQQIVYDSESLTLRRPVVRLLGSFGLLALILTTLGLYAVLSYSVSERTREIGIRMALGARRRQVLRQIALDTLRSVAPGATAGMLAAYWLTSLLPSGHIGWSGSGVFLYGVSRADMATYLMVVATLAGVAMFATFVPAKRAMQVDPATALRHE